MKVLMVDDHEMFLDGMNSILKDVEGIDETQMVNNSTEALEIIKGQEIDVLITDISMPEINGKNLCKTVREISPGTRVIVLTMHDEYHHISSLLEAGASGYLLKNTRHGELINAIKAVYNNEDYYCQEVKEIYISSKSKSPNSNKKYHDAKLSKREIEVIKLIAEEYTTEEIADKLHLSIFTIESHRRNILIKTRAKNIVGAIVYSFRAGIIK